MEKSKAMEIRNLKYVFTNEELVKLGKDYANANRQLAELEDQKKTLMAQMNSQIAAQKEMVSMLTSTVGNGYKYEDVECEVTYHTPNKGMKIITRTDIDDLRTGMDRNITEKMTDKDWMLWNDHYAKHECDVEFHAPDVNSKTLTQRTTGHKFIEQMTGSEIGEYEQECGVVFHKPKEGWKTLTHLETEKVVEMKMNPDDIEKTQGKLFKDEEQSEYDATPVYAEIEEVEADEEEATDNY